MRREHTAIRAGLTWFIEQLEREATAGGRYQEIRRSHASRLRVMMDDAEDQVEAFERAERKFPHTSSYGQIAYNRRNQLSDAPALTWQASSNEVKEIWESIAQAVIEAYEVEVFG